MSSSTIPLTTGSLALALLGKVGPCFDERVPVTPLDARFVAWPGSSAKFVNPEVTDGDAVRKFCTLEQAQCMAELLKFAYPGSDIQIVDYPGALSWPGFRSMEYVNAGGLEDPRIYKLSGTVKLNGADGPDLPISCYPAEYIRYKIVNFGMPDAEQLGYPYGATKLVAMNYFGMARPLWTGGDKTK